MDFSAASAPAALLKRSIHLISFSTAGSSTYDFPDQRELTVSPQQEMLDSLCEMYSVLKEEDYWVGMWLKRAQYSETVTALAYQQQGLFEQAQSSFEVGK